MLGKPINLETWRPKKWESRILLALLSDASNLDCYRICNIAQVAPPFGVKFLFRLEKSNIVYRTPHDAPEAERRYYKLLPEGRVRAMAILGLFP